MSKNLFKLAFASAAAVAGIAGAAVVPTVTAYPASQLPAAFQANYTAYRITLTPGATEKLAGIVAFSGAGGVSGTGVTGSFLQRQAVNGNADGFTPTPFSGSGASAAGSANSVDSKFINVVTNPAPVNPDENFTNAAVPNGNPGDVDLNTPRVGLGTSITGIYALPSTLVNGQASDVLYLVLPNSATGTAAITVQVATSSGAVNQSLSIPVGGVIPEPTTAALAGVALAGLGLRRRK